MNREEKLALYEKVIATQPGAVLKGDTIPYTSLNGHMYSYMHKEDFLALRLPTDLREGFMIKYKTALVTAYGIVQKEYVAVPDTLLTQTRELAKYFQAAHNYVAGMKPKATKKAKK